MGSIEFTILGVGLIVVILLLVLISNKKNPLIEIQRLLDEINQLRNTISTRESLIQTNFNQLNEANNKINQFQSTEKENEKRLLQIISEKELKIKELHQNLSNLKNENINLNGIITNHKNNIPNILKIRKDNSDLLFFYRELIHTIVYYNPIHTNILEFKNNVSSIDDNLKRKQIADKFGECLKKMDFSDLDQKLEKFKKIIVKMIFTPFYEVGEMELGIHNVKQGEIFCKKVFESIDGILISRQADLETIGELYQILMTHYDKWRKILSMPDFIRFILAAWEGIKIGLINEEYGNNFGDLLHSWEESYNLNDDDFVELYNNTIQKLIETSAQFSRNLDIDFTEIEILYQEYQEIENSLLHKKIQMLLTSGDDILNVYSIWRRKQSKTLLNEYPFLIEQILDELKTKKISENSLENIKDLVCSDCLVEINN